MVFFGNSDMRTIKLTRSEQTAVLQYCYGLPADIHQMLFMAAGGKMILTEPQCREFRRIVESQIERTGSRAAADLLISVSHKLIPNSVIRSFVEQIEDMNFQSIEQMQACADTVRDRHNNTPDSSFGGLTPAQTYRLIQLEWDHPDFPVRFNEDLPEEILKESPLFHNATVLLRVLTDRKDQPTATAKGNLNRKAVAAMLNGFRIEDSLLEHTLAVSKKIDELDMLPVWMTRLICQEAGLIARSKNKFRVTRKADDLLKPEHAGRLYRQIFLAYFRKINIGFYDRLPEFEGLQSTLGYTLYHLHRLAANEVHISRIADKIILPAVWQELKSFERQVFSALFVVRLRVIEPLENTGLLICRREQKNFLPEITFLKTSPLFRQFINFRL